MNLDFGIWQSLCPNLTLRSGNSDQRAVSLSQRDTSCLHVLLLMVPLLKGNMHPLLLLENALSSACVLEKLMFCSP